MAGRGLARSGEVRQPRLGVVGRGWLRLGQAGKACGSCRGAERSGRRVEVSSGAAARISGGVRHDGAGWVRRVGVRSGTVRHGTAGLARRGFVWRRRGTVIIGKVRRGRHDRGWRAEEGLGFVGQAWCGGLWRGGSLWGSAWSGRRDEARRLPVGNGGARHGKAGLAGVVGTVGRRQRQASEGVAGLVVRASCVEESRGKAGIPALESYLGNCGAGQHQCSDSRDRQSRVM